MVTKISPAGVSFIASGEGFVSRTYRDQGGVLTIGYGFTNLSAVFSAYWRKKRGRALRMGDTITRDEAREVLTALIDQEYAPPVVKRFGSNLPQHVFDACVSACYNAGSAILHDAWSRHVPGNLSEAGRLLCSTRVTARGRPSQGLRNRRAKEAALLQHGVYGDTYHANLDVTDYQRKLATLGFYKGKIDGIAGPATKRAVAAFQTANPPLVVDGIAGPATKAALTRAVEERNSKLAGSVTAAAVAPAAVTAGVAAGGGSIPWAIVAGFAALVIAAVVMWALIRKKRS